MKWPVLAVLLYYVVTQPDQAADIAVAIWNGLLTVMQGIFSFIQSIFDRT